MPPTNSDDAHVPPPEKDDQSLDDRLFVFFRDHESVRCHITKRVKINEIALCLKASGVKYEPLVVNLRPINEKTETVAKRLAKLMTIYYFTVPEACDHYITRLF